MNWLSKLLSTAPNAIKGQIDLQELWKAIATAVGPSVLVGLAVAGLDAINSNLALIIPNPIVASMAGYILSLIIDLIRRQSQGQTPVQVPAGAVLQVPGSFVPGVDRIAPVASIAATPFIDPNGHAWNSKAEWEAFPR